MTTVTRCVLCGGPSTWTSPTGHSFCDGCRTKHRSPSSELDELLDRVDGWLRRFVVFPNDHGSIAVTLWVAATHIVSTLDVAPYLLITAPEIESAKTRLMEIAAPLCHKPMFSSSMTPPVLFRSIDRDHPTVFLDEADNLWTGRGDDKAAEMVALLNAGHRRGIKAHRMGGPGKTTLQEFDVFGPKAIAGAFPDVGRIPEALRSRSIHLRMQRKLPGESVARWTRQTRQASEHDVAALRDQLAAVLKDAKPTEIHVDPLEALSDRDFDIWEPLLQIAAKAGGKWPKEAEAAAVTLCAPDALQAIPDRIQVLGDIGDLWEGTEPFMLTATILDRLHQMAERRWADYYGSPLTPHRLGKFLGYYGIESKHEPRRDGEGASRRKGYYRQDLEGFWARYTPGSVPNAPTSPSQAAEGMESMESISDGYNKEPNLTEGSSDGP